MFEGCDSIIEVRWQGTGTCHMRFVSEKWRVRSKMCYLAFFQTYWFTLRYLSASSSRRENFCIRPAGSSPLVINFIFRRIQFHISLSSAAYLDGRLWFSSINATTSSYLACQRSDWVIEDWMVAALKIFQNLIQNLSVGEYSCQIFIQILWDFEADRPTHRYSLGRWAQNLSKSYSKSFCWWVLLSDFYSDFCEILRPTGRPVIMLLVAALKIFQNLIQNLSVGDSSCQIFIQILVRFWGR